MTQPSSPPDAWPLAGAGLNRRGLKRPEGGNFPFLLTREKEVSAPSVVMILFTIATLGFLGWALIRSVRQERQDGQRISGQFGLGLALLALFGVSWIAHGLGQWEVFRQEQQMHGEPVILAQFINEFGQSTLENWQSEFLQLLTMVVLAAVFIYRGSAESRDSQDRIEQKIDSLLERLGGADDGQPPPRSANKPEWVDHAIKQGARRDDVESMTKDDLIDRYGDA